MTGPLNKTKAIKFSNKYICLAIYVIMSIFRLKCTGSIFLNWKVNIANGLRCVCQAKTIGLKIARQMWLSTENIDFAETSLPVQQSRRPLVSRNTCTCWVPGSCWPHPGMVAADWSTSLNTVQIGSHCYWKWGPNLQWHIQPELSQILTNKQLQ